MSESTYSYNGPECPYCRHQHTADESDYNESGFDMDCGACGKSFNVLPQASWSWTSRPIVNEDTPG